MFLPLKDRNPLRVIPFQAVTVGLIAVCVLVFLWEMSLGEYGLIRAVHVYGTIPDVLLGRRELPPGLTTIPPAATLLTSMFLHGGWLHLGSNMLYLWVFGDNIEDAMGHLRFLVFYLACGVVAALTHSLLAIDTTAPMVGASGAISGVLGAYLLLHPKVRVLVLVFYRVPLPLPAYIVLGGWIVLQVVSVYYESPVPGEGMTAWWAHIGGFVAGIALIVPMRRKGVPLFDRGRY